MAEGFQGHLLNIMMLVLTAERYDYFKLREMSRSMMAFLTSVDGTGSSISMTPWLRFIAPDFFGFNSGYRDNKPMLDLLRVINIRCLLL